MKAGLIDQELVAQIWCRNVIQAWEKLEPVAAIGRRKMGDTVWENFEYLAVLAQDWIAAHPTGTYPTSMRRAELKDEWRDADEKYAASLTPA